MIFNTLIPISLMVAAEIIKSIQVGVIEKDSEMKLDPDDKLKVLTMKLHEDLGSVRYIFSDKTGTLTKNEMNFRACSIFGNSFGETEEDVEKNLEINNNPNLQNLNSNNTKSCSTKTSSKKSIFCSTFNKDFLKNAILEGGILKIKEINQSPIQTLGEACREFFYNISLNHNVLTEKEEINKNTETNDYLTYQGSNPDEVVLVTAAAELGIKFIDKNKDYLNIIYFDEPKSFKILHKFEFSSERKRSSIVIEDENKNIKIYVKGSDEKILHQKNINDFSKNFLLKDTKDHLDLFARNGLRTLCYSFKNIEINYYNQWEKEYEVIKQMCIIDKSQENVLEKHISKIEENLILLGATALEDKLQDNVKNDIQEFIEAGIGVWMITGDKLDTAESIGHSCKLFNDDTEVFKIKSSEKEVTK